MANYKSEYGMNILETQFKQREFDGKWERIAKIVDYDNQYSYETESSSRVTFIPVGFAPWGEFSQNKEFVIDKSHVVCTMVPIQEFVNQYNTMFSGILMPDKKIIL